jgi:molybdopterin synthase catalytic subunit/molybdopterin synthase sulfur carrier subunit
MIHVRVRLGAGLARRANAPLLSLDLPDDATVADALASVGDAEPALAAALPSALPVVAGEHAHRDRRLASGEEVALLMPISGGT